jgi:hypothetical protein
MRRVTGQTPKTRAVAAMADEADAPPRRTGRQAGYPGKSEFGFADQQLRRALSQLARDPDAQARAEGARIVQEATATLHALARRAYEASTEARRVTAQAERLGQRLDARVEQLRRRGGGGA